MKKLIYCALALATGLFAASCQQENLEPVQGGNTVTFTVEIPELATKGAESTLLVDKLVYAVYRVKDSNTKKEAALADLRNTCEFIYQYEQEVTATRNIVSLELINNQRYVVAFWAQKDDKWFTHNNNTTDNKGATEYQFAVEGIDLTNYSPNTLEFDAFSGVDFIDAVNGSASKSIELKRPFAQLNIATNLPETFAADVKKTKVTVNNVARSYNVVTNVATVDNTNPVVFEATAPLSTEYTSYDKYISMNYVFVPEDRVSVTVSYEIETEAHGIVTNTIDYVPLARNYKTNIVGNLLTSKVDYTVDIINDWGRPDYEIKVWDGETISAPAYNEETKTYSITDGSELAWLAAAVSGTLTDNTKANLPADSFAGKTFVLTKDINLGDAEWTPIGKLNDNSKHFEGTFDGQGHVISNMRITKGVNGAALFKSIAGTVTIKNVTIEKASVVYPGQDDFYGSALVGTAYGKVTIENVTVKDSYISGNNKVAGILAHDGVMNSLTIDDCHVEGCVIESLNQEDGGNVAGLVGLYQTNAEATIQNSSVKNTVINGINSTNTGKRSNGEFIACISGKDNLVVNIIDCEVSGNTFTQNEGVTYVSPYGVFVGGNRDDNGKGTVIVDGYECIANGVGVKGNTYNITTANGLVWVEAQADDFFAGKTVQFGCDINMAGVTIEKPIKFWQPENRTTVNGQNYTISNLTMSTTSTAKEPFGLFGGTADIKNIKFDNANITGYSYVAVIAGNLYGDIDNCHVSNSSVTAGYWMAGAMSGQYNGGNVTNCSVTKTEIKCPAAAGAIVGNINEAVGERKIENCEINECTIKTNGTFGGNYDMMFGSVIGLINISNSKVYLTNCRVTNTTVKGQTDSALYGVSPSSTIVYIDGVMQVENKVLHEASGLYYNGNDKPGQGVYYIGSADDLKKAVTYFIGADPNNEANKVTIELLTNIDLAGQDWTPWDVMWITLNGNNHTISNINVSAAWRSGLFGYLGAATINDLTLKNVTVSGAQAGILAGSVEGVTVNNVKIAGENVVNYLPYSTETYGGIGSVTGIFTGNTVNAEILSSSVVTLNYNDLVTNASYKNEFIGYVAGNYSNTGTITKSGSVEQVGDINSQGVSYEFDYESAQLTIKSKAEYGKTVYRGYISDGSTYGISHIVVSEDIERLNDRAFCKNTQLKTVSLPNSLTYIDEGVFQQSGFTSITVPENVTYIGKTAFGACPDLETIIIYAKNVTFANYVGRDSGKLKEIYIYSDSITFESGSMYFTNKQTGDASGITFYVKNQEIADQLYTASSASSSYGMKILSLDGSTTFYNTLK